MEAVCNVAARMAPEQQAPTCTALMAPISQALAQLLAPNGAGPDASALACQLDRMAIVFRCVVLHYLGFSLMYLRMSSCVSMLLFFLTCSGSVQHALCRFITWDVQVARLLQEAWPQLTAVLDGFGADERVVEHTTRCGIDPLCLSPLFSLRTPSSSPFPLSFQRVPVPWVHPHLWPLL